MKYKVIASVSWGKDSLAMLILILEHNIKVDEVVFYDTGMEFEAIYKMRDKMLPNLIKRGIKYTELKPKMPFLDMMINYKHNSRKGVEKKGYGWCGGLCRWGTTYKVMAINNYCKNAIQLVGIAINETERLDRLEKENKRSILAEFNMTEQDCLDLCYSRGYDWKGLYNILDRVSCWCCRNKNLKELQAYKDHLPDYFERLCELENIIGEPMKKPKYLNERFIVKEQRKRDDL